MWRALRIPLASAKTARSHHPTIALLSATTAMGLVAAANSSSSASVASNAGAPEKIALSPKEFRAFKVRSVEAVTHDTKHVVFDLPSAEHEMGLTVASCLMARAEINGESVVRPYTPVNATDTKGVLELVVKGYPTGKMSKHIVNLSVGDTLEMKGPFEKFKYKANEYKTISFLAGGSGITPLLQIVKEIVRNPDDTTRLVLIYANKEERDIILRDELDALVRMYPQFSVHYVLSDPPANGWTGRVGYITKDLVQDLVPPPSATDAWVLVCGPPPMMEALSGDKNPDKSQGDLRGLLKDLQYTSKQVYKY